MIRFLHEWVTLQAERRPDATALVWHGRATTYAELERDSNRLARVLREAGCTRGSRVGLLLPKSPAAVVAILGVLKAGAIYVPLDPASPPARLARIIASYDDRWILAAGPVAGVLGELFECPLFRAAHAVGWLESAPALDARFAPAFDWSDVLSRPADPPAYAGGSDDVAHLLFTSGSTGLPKGVAICHRNVIPFVEWATDYFGIAPTDRVSGHPPLHFDLSTFDMFGTFAAGAELHLVPPELNLLPHRLAAFIRESELTQWFSVPSVLNYLAKFDAVGWDDFPALRRILWCGEVFPTPPLIHWMRRLPHVSFTNLYGPTEATIASSYHTLPRCPSDDREPIPIGTGCAGEELLVLDERLRPAPAGQTGELYIRGVGLSPGYWRDPEKTRAAFLPHPAGRDPQDRIYRTGDLARVGPDGLVYFLGRADTQIKSRGYRIELGEVESSLNTLEELRECAVVAVDRGGFEGAVICCAYHRAAGAEATPASLRKRLGRLIPAYMVPARWMELDALPKNGNGKIDRRALREAFERAIAEPAGRAEAVARR